jgi:glyceraldehyde 3-phosphate dehydrogenase
MRIAVNGCGRIGKSFIRALLADKKAQERLTLVVINVGMADKETIALSLKYDTLLGISNHSFEYHDGTLTIDGSLKVAVISELDPAAAPWKKYSIDWVVECTGRFTHRDGAQKHITAGARKVLISAPAKGDDVTIILGVNEQWFDPEKHSLVSLGSCTTNAVYPMLKVLQDSVGIESAFMTTVHAYTNSQALLDLDPHVKDPRKSRAAALNIIPASTGAMKVVDKVMPELVGKLAGSALRVPVGKVSLIDLTVTLKKSVTAEALNALFKKAAEGPLKGLVGYATDPLVSSDYSGSDYSVTLDSLLTSSLGQSAKLFGWYDNEWGYSVRLKDFLLYAAK